MLVLAQATSTSGSAGERLGKVVSPEEPRTKGLYWGFTTRFARGLSAVFTEGPYMSGYDVTIGTSEHGSTDILNDRGGVCSKLRSAQHLLIAVGGLHGLEAAVKVDGALEVKDPSCVFDLYVNTCAMQGSRTIRSEEAILISLASLTSCMQAL